MAENSWNVTKVRLRDSIPIIGAELRGPPTDPFVRKVVHEGKSKPAPELLNAVTELRHIARRYYELEDWKKPTSCELGTVNWSETEDGRVKVTVALVFMTELSSSAITLNLAFAEGNPDSPKATDAPQYIINAAQVLREACEDYLDGAQAQGDMFRDARPQDEADAEASREADTNPHGAAHEPGQPDFRHIADHFTREDAAAGEPDPVEEADDIGNREDGDPSHRIMPDVPRARGRRPSRGEGVGGFGTTH